MGLAGALRVYQPRVGIWWGVVGHSLPRCSFVGRSGLVGWLGLCCGFPHGLLGVFLSVDSHSHGVEGHLYYFGVCLVHLSKCFPSRWYVGIVCQHIHAMVGIVLWFFIYVGLVVFRGREKEVPCHCGGCSPGLFRSLPSMGKMYHGGGSGSRSPPIVITFARCSPQQGQKTFLHVITT